MGKLLQDGPMGNSSREIEVQPVNLQEESAALSLAAQFLLEDIDSELDEPPQGVQDNIFGDIMAHDEDFYGEDGNEILFSAGKNPLDEELESESQIWQEIDGLKYYDHSYLAQTLGDEPEDVTIPRSIAALEALGELCPR
jgi:hypothetical protein